MARDGLDSNSHSLEAETATKAEKLVGKYFHGANENNKVEWQGVVIGEPNPGWYLVQLFDWATGKPKRAKTCAHRKDERLVILS